MASSGVLKGDYRERINENLKGASKEPFYSFSSLPAVPVKVSTDYSIADLEKPTAVHLFREDFGPDNRVQFGGKFKGNWTVKANAAVKVEGSANHPRLFLSDDVQINGPVAGTNLQLKLKPDLVSAQMDFGHTFFRAEYDTPQGAVRIDQFVNPYLYFESDRVFNNQLYGLGVMYYLNNFLRDNIRLNFYKRENLLNWNLQSNTLYSYKGMFLSMLFTLTYNDFFALKNRRLMLGYDKNDINANVELGFEAGSFKKWNLVDTTATVSYNFREKGLMGVFFRTYFMRDNTTPINECGVGYSNRLSKDLDFKAKLSLSGILNLFANYRLREGLYVQPSVMTSLSSPSKKGFLTLPFDFGLKVKLER